MNMDVILPTVLYQMHYFERYFFCKVLEYESMEGQT